MSVQSDAANDNPDVESDRPDSEADAEKASTDSPPPDAGLTPEDALEAQQARADENWDKYMRAAAELDNVRKRASREVDKARKFALERFSAELLAVKDSLELGLAAGDDADVKALREGSEATLKLLTSVFEHFGVSEVDPHGEPFDPQVHEAITMQPSPDAEPGSVLSVFQKGYTLNGRLLRPARVVVAAEPTDD